MKWTNYSSFATIMLIFAILAVLGFQKLQGIQNELFGIRERLNAPAPTLPTREPVRGSEPPHSIPLESSAIALLRKQLQDLVNEREQLAVDTRANPSVRPREQLNGLPVYSASELDKTSGQPKVRPQTQRIPVYPKELRAAKVNGSVDVSFVVGLDGRVHAAEVLKSSDPGFEAAAIEAVNGWSFTPGLRQGAPVNARIPMTIKFSIGPEAPPHPRWF